MIDLQQRRTCMLLGRWRARQDSPRGRRLCWGRYTMILFVPLLRGRIDQWNSFLNFVVKIIIRANRSRHLLQPQSSTSLPYDTSTTQQQDSRSNHRARQVTNISQLRVDSNRIRRDSCILIFAESLPLLPRILHFGLERVARFHQLVGRPQIPIDANRPMCLITGTRRDTRLLLRRTVLRL